MWPEEDSSGHWSFWSGHFPPPTPALQPHRRSDAIVSGKPPGSLGVTGDCSGLGAAQEDHMQPGTRQTGPPVVSAPPLPPEHLSPAPDFPLSPGPLLGSAGDSFCILRSSQAHWPSPQIFRTRWPWKYCQRLGFRLWDHSGPPPGSLSLYTGLRGRPQGAASSSLLVHVRAFRSLSPGQGQEA